MPESRSAEFLSGYLVIENAPCIVRLITKAAEQLPSGRPSHSGCGADSLDRSALFTSSAKFESTLSRASMPNRIARFPLKVDGAILLFIKKHLLNGCLLLLHAKQFFDLSCFLFFDSALPFEPEPFL